MTSENKQVIQYIESSGKSLTLILESTTPLILKDIEEVILNKNTATLNLEFLGKEILDNKSCETPANINASMGITFHRKAGVFCLTKGGWLPPIFIASAIFLVDKNVLIKLKKFANNEKRPDYEHTNWWLQFPSKIIINPILFAMEGCNQKKPNFKDFHSQFESASDSIRKLLPNSETISYTAEHYQAAYQQLAMFEERSKIEINFLMEISSILQNRSLDKGLESNKQKILSIADSVGLVKPSLVLITALACVFENKHGNGLLIARRILKPLPSYSSRNAFNAVSDLRAIEMLIAGMCINHTKNISLMTCDIGIAALWCALNPKRFRMDSGKPKFELSLSQDLFPRMRLEELNQLSLEIL